jgi:hypothetical protein
MKLLMAGLPPREAAALGILVGMSLKNWETSTAQFTPGRALPLADVYVLDMVAAGLGPWSAGAEARLLEMLHGRPAVLLHQARDMSWIEANTAGARQQHLVWLAKPCNTDGMRDALKAATSPTPRRSTSLPPMGSASAPRPPALFAARDAAAASRQAPLPADVYTAPAQSARAMSQDDLAALHRTFPQLKQYPVLDRSVQAAASPGALELRFTVRESLLIHARDGWVACTAPRAAIERLCRQNALAPTLSEREVSDGQAAEWAHRLGARRESLDAYLWSLAAVTLGSEPLSLTGDAQLHLRSFPDYTRLAGISDLFIQLAAICVRLPQSLSGLQAAFPACNPQEIRRFAMFTVLSGAGHLTTIPATPGGVSMANGPAVNLRVRKAALPVRQGFFQAMLAKLF